MRGSNLEAQRKAESENRSSHLYREAVTSTAQGYRFGYPGLLQVSMRQPQRGCVRCRNPFRVDNQDYSTQG
jgi:hypothetical protein